MLGAWPRRARRRADLLDLGTDSDGGIVVGDHNINDPHGGRATGAGTDRIVGSNGDDLLIADSSVADASVTVAGNDSIIGRGGNDTLFGDNVNFKGNASVGTAGGDDSLGGGDGADTLRAGPGDDFLNGGPHKGDDCDDEAGTDAASRCEILAGVP